MPNPDSQGGFQGLEVYVTVGSTHLPHELPRPLCEGDGHPGHPEQDGGQRLSRRSPGRETQPVRPGTCASRSGNA